MSSILQKSKVDFSKLKETDVKIIKINRLVDDNWDYSARLDDWVYCLRLRRQGDWAEDLQQQEIITDLLHNKNHQYMVLDRGANIDLYVTNSVAVDDVKKCLEVFSNKRNLWVCYVQEVLIDESQEDWPKTTGQNNTH